MVEKIIHPVPPLAKAVKGPSIKQLTRARKQLGSRVLLTPCWSPWALNHEDVLEGITSIGLKMELLQHTGSFKVRATLLALDALSAEQKKQGVVGVSAGNHAMALSYAARIHQLPCVVIMPKTAVSIRQDFCRQMAADVILLDDIQACFSKVEEFIATGLHYVPPFEGRTVATGTGTIGLEIIEQIPKVDAIVCALGGGGLCAGVANAVKQSRPRCQVYAVEPLGANSMTRSFISGKPETAGTIQTVADSLSAPYAEPYSYSLCAQNVDGIVNVTDDEIKHAMRFCFNQLKLAIEPACATAIAAVLGSLKAELAHQSVAVIMCGSNIDIDTFNQIIAAT